MTNFSVVIALTISALACGQLNPSPPLSYELPKYGAKIKILHDMLIEEGCESVSSGVFNLHDQQKKRNILGASIEDKIHLQTERVLYNMLVSRIVECRKAKISHTPTSPPITKAPTTAIITKMIVKTSYAPKIPSTKMIMTSPLSTKLPTSTSTQAPTTRSATTVTTQGQLHKFTGLKIAASSKSMGGRPPQNVINGIIPNNTYDPSFCHADSTEDRPYVIVDLGAIRTVINLVFWPRYNIFEQASNMEFRVAPTIEGLDDRRALCYRRPGEPTVRPERFNCTYPIKGRYVKVERYDTKTSNWHLCFQEIEIFGY